MPVVWVSGSAGLVLVTAALTSSARMVRAASKSWLLHASMWAFATVMAGAWADMVFSFVEVNGDCERPSLRKVDNRKLLSPAIAATLCVARSTLFACVHRSSANGTRLHCQSATGPAPVESSTARAARLALLRCGRSRADQWQYRGAR